MKPEDIKALCRRAHDVGAVRHEDFADYVVVLEARRRVGAEWQTVETAYMAVDGKLAMANEDHRKQGKRLDFGEPRVMVDTPDHLTLQVTVTSEIYGSRHGTATSRRKTGAAAEREFPWEVAETSAIGRALAAMGYGLLPGAGLASAEDAERVGAAERPAAERPAAVRRPYPVSTSQHNRLVQLYRERHGGTSEEAARGLDALFLSVYKHPLGQATAEEASRIIAQLAARKAQTAEEDK